MSEGTQSPPPAFLSTSPHSPSPGVNHSTRENGLQNSSRASSSRSQDILSPPRLTSPEKSDQGDIGHTLASPRSPTFGRTLVSPKLRSPNINGHFPNLRSPSPQSFRISPSIPAEDEYEAGPSSPRSEAISLTSTPTRSRNGSPSNGSHSMSITSPPIPFRPILPSETIAIANGEPSIPLDADGIPFESISLTNSPPHHAVTLPPSPTTLHTRELRAKRSSWGGFGVNGDARHHASGSSSTLPAVHHGDRRHSTAVDLAEENGEKGPSPPPIKDAPPAHPHPYPLPTATTTIPHPPPHSPSQNTKSSNHTTHPSTSSIPSSTSPPDPSQPSTSTSASTSSSTFKPLKSVKGLSTFEKVISHTRPSWLPPKDRTEDETHLHQWEEMMNSSKEAEQVRQREAEARRLEKERRLAMNVPAWERLLGEGDVGIARVRSGKDGEGRRMWFEGIPGYLRGKAWSLAIGNPLALSKDAYKMYSARARKSVESGRFPKQILEQVERDMNGTLPTLRLFTPGSPVRADLKEMICAWVVYRSDDGLGYAPYITHLAAMFLLTSPPPIAFLSLTNLLARPCLRAFFTQDVDEIDAYYRVFENLQAESFPKIYANCKALGLKLPESYFRSMLVEQVPFEAVCRLWDQIALDGDGYIFRAALAIFGFLEPRLYYPDREEIESILEGRNAATLAITLREKERARLRGEAYQEELDGKLSVFGLSEGALFGWLENDGWKESRFERLVVREMPD